MTSHTDCKHPATKLGRAHCRQIRKWLDRAESYGLEVKRSETTSEGISQWTIKRPDDIHGSYLIITVGYSITVHRVVPLLPDRDEFLAMREVLSWIKTLANIIH